MTDTDPPQEPASAEALAEEPETLEKIDGEAIAVPSGDITGAITEAIEEATDNPSEGSR